MAFGRQSLLGGTAALALLAAAGAAHAQTVVNGGGSTLASPTYGEVFNLLQAANPTFDFSDGYFPSGSGSAQASLLTNTTNTSTTVAGASTPFELGASDATATQNGQLYSTSNPSGAWNTSSTGAAVAGDLIVIPSIGTPITVPLNFGTALTNNTTVNLSTNDLCGIFSGAITQWSQVTDANIPGNPGAITVVFRADGSGTSFLFTQHLAAVCTTSNTAPGVTFRPTTSFASLFTTLPGNFKGATGSPGVQSLIASTQGATGYLSPDYTKIINGPTNPSQASYVAEVNGQSPTSTATQAALATGTPVTDPVVNPSSTAYNPADPNSFVPVAANPGSGYPIVGYTTIWLAQCYADPNVAAAVKLFMTDLYRNAAVRAIETTNGFTPIPTNLATTVTADYLLGNTGASTINGAGVGGCSGKAGR